MLSTLYLPARTLWSRRSVKLTPVFFVLFCRHNWGAAGPFQDSARPIWGCQDQVGGSAPQAEGAEGGAQGERRQARRQDYERQRQAAGTSRCLNFFSS